MTGTGQIMEELARRGGVAGWGALVQVAGRATVERAVAGGEVVRVARGVLGLAGTAPAVLAAASVHGTVSHVSAAQLWMVETLRRPTKVSVTVPRHAHRRPVPGVLLHYADLCGGDVAGPVTAPVRTVLDCARTLPFGEALGIADGFLRLGLVDPGDLRAEAAGLRGPGSSAALRVARAADARSDNPFESALRAVVMLCGAGDFVPQVSLRLPGHGLVRPDLLDLGRRIALEADSFRWHGSRAALVRDCERYDALVVAGFCVLRFTWEQVVGRPDEVAVAVRTLVSLADERSGSTRGGRRGRPGHGRSSDLR
ncbi:hypothetical protein [Pseudokineococcus sp. 1T1Z-3]|uniref:hypothetical protein n=1 Tax=Pseudokineococcus sp. 1T1Z-3 TaxID=3132745 RepID=UPI0030B37AB8